MTDEASRLIQVGPVQAAQPSHHQTALDTMALAPVRLALALPVLRGQEQASPGTS